MTSAGREARERAWMSSRLGGFVVSREAFDEGWSACSDHARGATVAEIVEALENAYHPQNPIPDHPADFVEREFSEHPEGDKR